MVPYIVAFAFALLLTRCGFWQITEPDPLPVNPKEGVSYHIVVSFLPHCGSSLPLQMNVKSYELSTKSGTIVVPVVLDFSSILLELLLANQVFQIDRSRGVPKARIRIRFGKANTLLLQN